MIFALRFIFASAIAIGGAIFLAWQLWTAFEGGPWSGALILAASFPLAMGAYLISELRKDWRAQR